MDEQKVMQLANGCLERLDRVYPAIKPAQLLPKQMEEVVRGITYDHEVAHLKFMCRNIIQTAPNDLNKATLWLGFVQGNMWSRSELSLKQLIDLSEGS